MQKNLIHACEGRTDKLAIDVKARIDCAGDCAVEAKYHRNCMRDFLRDNNQGYPNVKTNTDVDNDNAFTRLFT